MKNPCNATEIILRWDRGTLRLDGWPPDRTPPAESTNVWQWDNRIDSWRCEAIHYRQVLEQLTGTVHFLNEVMRPVDVHWPQVSLPELRTEQAQALEAWLQAGGRGRSSCLPAPAKPKWRWRRWRKPKPPRWW